MATRANASIHLQQKHGIDIGADFRVSPKEQHDNAHATGRFGDQKPHVHGAEYPKNYHDWTPDTTSDAVGRSAAIEESEFALGGAVAHLETVTQALADWNAAPELGHGADADLKAVHRANRWDAVYQQSEDVLRRLLDLTAAVESLKGEER